VIGMNMWIICVLRMNSAKLRMNSKLRKNRLEIVNCDWNEYVDNMCASNEFEAAGNGAV